MIRQAISCDICGSEKKQTNHWFVAYDQSGELRISGWLSRNRLRPGAKHLCGQTCLHKLIDEFMARDMAARPSVAAAAEVEAQKQVRLSAESNDISLIADAAYEEDFESSARLIPTPAKFTSGGKSTPVVLPPAAMAKPSVLRPAVELVPSVSRVHVPEPEVVEETPRFTSRNWRAEAWEREREREQHALPRHSGIAARRRSNG